MKIKNILSESVSFFLDQHDPKSDFSDVLSISFYMARKFDEHARQYPFFYKHLQGNFPSFDPDSDDYNKATGTVNLYPGRKTAEMFRENFFSVLQKAIDDTSKHVTIGDIKIEGIKPEYDKPRLAYDKNKGTMQDIGVIRIPIIKNDNDVEDLEFSISNANARNFLNALELNGDDLMGEIPYSEIPRLLMKINNIQDTKKHKMTRNPESGQRIHDSGVDMDRVDFYLKSLTRLLQPAIKKKSGIVYS